jgi:hypothetical protein
MRRSTAVLTALFLAWPVASRASSFSFTVEGFYGPANRDTLKLKSGVANFDVDGTHGTFGAAALLKLSVVEVGALWEQGISIPYGNDTVWAALLGLGLDAPGLLRWELLGELGGHHVSDIGAAGSGVEVWLPYAGVRPGISYRMDAGPLRILVGAWGFWRWDLSNTAASVAGVNVPAGSFDVGGSSRGIEFRLGLEI